MMRKTTLLIILILLAAVAGAYLYLRSSGKGFVSQELDEEFLAHLPANTQGFFYGAMTSESTKEYIAHPGYRLYLKTYMEAMEKLPMPEGFDTYFEVLRRIGFWVDNEGPYNPSLDKIAWLGVPATASPDGDTSLPIQVAFLAQLIEGRSGKELVETISDVLKKDNFSVTQESVPGGTGISFEIFATELAPEALNDPAAAAIDIYRKLLGKQRVFIAENGRLFTLTLSQKLMAELLAARAGADKPALLSSPGYLAFKARAKNLSHEMGFAYIDVRAVLEPLASRLGESFIPLESGKFPIKNLALTVGGRGAFIGELQAELETTDEQQKRWISILEKMAPYSAFDEMPAPAAFAFSISGELLKSVRNEFEESIGEGEPQQALKLVAESKEISLAFSAPGSDAAMPEMFMSLETENAAPLMDFVKRGIGGALSRGAGQDPMAMWKSKEIGGLTSDYVLTPFGIGMYLAKSDQALFFATSPTGIERLSKARNGEGSIQSALPAEFRQILRSQSAAWILVDYEEMAKLMDGFKRSFAMFIPQDQSAQFDLLQHSRHLGMIAMGAGIKNGILGISIYHRFNKVGGS